MPPRRNLILAGEEDIKSADCHICPNKRQATVTLTFPANNELLMISPLAPLKLLLSY